VDAIAVLSLVAAFVLAGWKIFNRLPAVSYVGVPQQTVLPGARLKAPPDARLPTAAAFTWRPFPLRKSRAAWRRIGWGAPDRLPS